MCDTEEIAVDTDSIDYEDTDLRSVDNSPWLTLSATFGLQSIPPAARNYVRSRCRNAESEFYSCFDGDGKAERHREEPYSTKATVEAMAQVDYSDAEYASAKAVVRGMIESLQLLVYRMREQHSEYEPPTEVDADRVPQI